MALMNGPCVGCSITDTVKNFVFQPITSAASNTEWFLFVGAILIAAYLWSRFLRHIEELL